jgi:hypothetical protein
LHSPTRAVLCAVTFFISIPWPAYSQRTVSLRGEIVGGGNANLGILTVELEDTIQHRILDRTLASPTGAFEFHFVPEGDLEVRVLSNSTLLKTQHLVAGEYSQTLHIEIHTPEIQTPSGGVISIARLRHKVVPKAEKAYREAQRKLDSGDAVGSFEQLRKAISIDPDYMEAHNNLGCRLLAMNKLPEALSEFQRAFELDPDAANVQANLAVVLCTIGRKEEAEKFARRAIQLDPVSTKIRYVLGMILYGEGKWTPEAVAFLRRSESEFPNARIAIDQIERRRTSGQAFTPR